MTTSPADALETTLHTEILKMYQEVADRPSAEFHFFHGAEAARRFAYPDDLLAGVPAGALASFAGVGNPHERAGIGPGETVLDLGSGAGMDAIIAARRTGPSGRVIAVDLNPAMCAHATRHAAEAGVTLDLRPGRIEALPIEDETVDVVISNGVINLSFRKAQVFRELFRVTRPGGRLSITDIVSARALSQNIVNDPKLWAS